MQMREGAKKSSVILWICALTHMHIALAHALDPVFMVVIMLSRAYHLDFIFISCQFTSHFRVDDVHTFYFAVVLGVLARRSVIFSVYFTLRWFLFVALSESTRDAIFPAAKWDKDGPR